MQALTTPGSDTSLRLSPFVHIFWGQIIVVPANKKTAEKNWVRQKLYSKVYYCETMDCFEQLPDQLMCNRTNSHRHGALVQLVSNQNCSLVSWIHLLRFAKCSKVWQRGILHPTFTKGKHAPSYKMAKWATSQRETSNFMTALLEQKIKADCIGLMKV